MQSLVSELNMQLDHYTSECACATYHRTYIYVLSMCIIELNARHRSSARNKASGLTRHLVAIFLIQGLLVHLCPDK